MPTKKPVVLPLPLPFRWNTEFQGDEIENFLITLCETVPTVATDLLTAGFGDFGKWIEDADGNTDSWKLATCGCLVGQSALCSIEKVDGLKPFLIEHEPPTMEAVDILFVAIKFARREKVTMTKNVWGETSVSYADASDYALRSLIDDVGMMVANESEPKMNNDWEDATDKEIDQRHAALSSYMLDFIRVTLTLMGYKNLPATTVLASKRKSPFVKDVPVLV